MGLFKRGQVWWMSFTVDGQRFRKSTETIDRKQALKIFDKLKGEIAEGKWFERLEGEDMTFRELMERYLMEYSVVLKKPKSYVRDKSLNNHLQRFFGDFILTEITPKNITEYKVKRRKDGASPRSINYELALMGHAFNLAVKEWELVRDNPVQRVSKEKVRNQIERWLTIEEERLLLNVSPKWLQEIILFAIHTGFRQSEILDLKWSQIDLARRTITISDQKNGDIDTLPIDQTVTDILQNRWKASHHQDDRVFLNTKGKRIGNRNLLRSFYRFLEKAQVSNCRFHDLRHTFASRLVQSGVDLYSVQKLGRWKSVEMIKRYAHHNPESLRARIEVLDNPKTPFVTNLAQS
jgi:integrase